MILERDKFQRETGRSWRIAFWTIVGLSLLAFLVSGPLLMNSPAEWHGIVYFSPLVLICCLLGAFAGLGSKVWRWPIVILIAPLVGWYADVSTGGHSITEFEVFVLGVIGVVAATTLSLRICRGSLIQMGPDEDAAAVAVVNQVLAIVLMFTLRKQGFRFVKRSSRSA
jgi:hypothetical protein